MIRTIHKGGIFALLLLVILVIPLHFFQFYRAFSIGNIEAVNSHFFNQIFVFPKLVYQILVIVILLIQAMWFGRLVNRHQFFETFTLWPIVVFLMFSIANHYQLLRPDLILFNFIFLYSYQRIFSITDDEMSDFQIYLDLGTAYAIGVLLFPGGIFFLPLFILAINQFAVFEINRFLLFILTFIMVTITILGSSYLFISKDWIWQFFQGMTLRGIDYSDLINPEVLYPYIALLVALVLLVPPILTSLTFMPNQNRKMINVMMLHLIFGVLVVLLSNAHKEAMPLVLTLPLSFLFTIGSGHIKSRLFANILLLLLVFALIFIQWVYIINDAQVL